MNIYQWFGVIAIIISLLLLGLEIIFKTDTAFKDYWWIPVVLGIILIIFGGK